MHFKFGTPTSFQNLFNTDSIDFASTYFKSLVFALNNTNKANNNRLINFLNKPQSIKLPQVSNDIIHEINKIKTPAPK